MKAMSSILRSNLLGHRIPLNVMWRLTNRCNQECSYCRIWKKKQKELGTEEVLRIMDELSSLGTQRLGFVGGEVFLRDDFSSIIDHAKSKGFYVTLVSNGCLVPDNLDIIKKIDKLVISFDGKKENHERGRAPGSFENVMNAFEALKASKIRILTNTVLTKYNLGDIDYILEKAEQYDFSCTFNLLQGKADCYPTRKQYQDVLSTLIHEKKKGAPIVLSIRTMKYLAEWKDHQKFITRERVPGFTCYCGRLTFNIDTDGTIARCDILTHRRKDNPNCAELGVKEAIKRIKGYECQACTCSHVIEYNHLFSLKPEVMYDWGKVILK